MTTLAGFLSARLDETASTAWAIHDVSKCDALLYEEDMAAATADTPYCDCGYPARVLREVEAMRAIIALHAVEVSREERRALAEDIAEGKPLVFWENEYRCVICGWFDAEQGACATVRHLAAIWSDHADHRQEGRP